MEIAKNSLSDMYIYKKMDKFLINKLIKDTLEGL